MNQNYQEYADIFFSGWISDTFILVCFYEFFEKTELSYLFYLGRQNFLIHVSKKPMIAQKHNCQNKSSNFYQNYILSLSKSVFLS